MTTRTDPLRLGLLRRRYLIDIEAVFNVIRRNLINGIVNEDRLGIGQVGKVVSNARYKGALNKDKVVNTFEWINSLTASTLVQKDWTKALVKAGHQRGILRGHTDYKGLPKDEVTKKIQSEFLKGMAVKTATLNNLQNVAFDYLEGINKEMGNQITKSIQTGLMAGKTKEQIAVDIVDRVDKIGLTRAKTLVETEIARAHSEGVLDSLETLGVTRIGVNVEWVTSNTPCELCSVLDSVILTIQQARGMFPRHPYCRCVPIPTRSRSNRIRLKNRIEKSVMEEIPQSLRKRRKSIKEQRKRSMWQGARN